MDVYDADYYASHYGRIADDADYYQRRAAFWRYLIQQHASFDANAPMLDYGCGLGQISAAFPDVAYYDIAEVCREKLKADGKTVYDAPDAIPEGHFTTALSSHSLEHCPDPLEILRRLHRAVCPGGNLVLMLPVEINLQTTLHTDGDNHLFAWTFQTITNLLRHAGWEPQHQAHVYDSFGLAKLSKWLGSQKAIPMAYQLGKFRGRYQSLFVHAKKPEA